LEVVWRDPEEGYSEKNIPRLRKISISPFADFDKVIENIRDEFIIAWKPNPAVLVASVWDLEAVQKEGKRSWKKQTNSIVYWNYT